MNNKQRKGLYRPEFEHSSCGIGFVANLKGRKSHKIVSDAISMLSRMEHRGGTGFDLKSGDGAGILTQMPHTGRVHSLHLGRRSRLGHGDQSNLRRPTPCSACRDVDALSDLGQIVGDVAQARPALPLPHWIPIPSRRQITAPRRPVLPRSAR